MYDLCRKQQWKNELQQQKRERNAAYQVMPSSTTPMKYLTVKELKTRAANLRENRKNKNKCIQRAMEQIKSCKEEMNMSRGLSKHYQKAMEEQLTNKSKLSKNIPAHLFDIIQE